MAFLTTQDQTEIYYNDLGHGDPVVLIHGWPLCSDMWEHQTRALLEQGFRVIAYDRRGFGKSAQPLDGYDYDTLASDLNDLIEHLDLSNVKLVGFSMGGGEVARYLSRYGSEKISQAVLVSSILPFMLKTSSNPDGVDQKVFDDILKAVKDDRPHFLAGFNKDFFGVGVLTSPVSNELLQWSANLALLASPKATVECAKSFSATDFRGDMKAFTIPTLIIHGTADKTVPIEASAVQATRLVPAAKYIPYDGAPHGLFITHKDALNEDLIAFFNIKGKMKTRFIDETRTMNPGHIVM